jgi:hypothetical protein
MRRPPFAAEMNQCALIPLFTLTEAITAILYSTGLYQHWVTLLYLKESKHDSWQLRER